MLKIAVIGAQTLLGREVVGALETRECSVLPLAAGPTSIQDEEGDIVVFAPSPNLVEGLDLIILAETPINQEMLRGFSGRILDMREGEEAAGEPMPLAGPWPKKAKRLKGRPAIEQVLAMVPDLVEGISGLSGIHLSSVASLGDRGIHGLAAQTRAILEGSEPDDNQLGYRAAFEAIPLTPRGSITEVRLPVFHGDMLILHLEGDLKTKEAPENAKWVEKPPTSREAAVSNTLLAHFAKGATPQSATLMLGFDPILWGKLLPTMRLLEL
jgi:aspartate-semialdehyde dehydrogenase